MSGPSDVPDINPLWAVVAAAGAILIAWAKKVDPRFILVWLNEPLMRKHIDPIRSDISHMRKVIDHMPGATEAHAAARAEEERWQS